MEKERYDNLEAYCGMLGHQVPFSYCRKPGSDTPCSRISGCWSAAINIDEYFSSLPPEDRLPEQPVKKLSRIEMILLAAQSAGGR